jgi:hypothetical protein
LTVSDICGRVLTRLDDSPSAPVSVYVASGDSTVNGVVIASEVLAAINEGQQLAAFLTLFAEKTAPFALNGSCWYTPRPTLTDLIVPLMITVGGIRLRPSTLAELDSWNSAWQATADTAARYTMLGCNLLAVTPQQTATATVTYAQSPAVLGPNDTPALPTEHHSDLISYALYKIKAKEGAQSLQRGLVELNSFLDSMQKLGSQVRAKSLLARLDTLPPELALFDRSKLVPEIQRWKGEPKPK